jgi:hypothetical protein
MKTYISPFDVKDNIQAFGKAYAFWAIRDDAGILHSLYLLWVATNMIKHADSAQREHAEYRYQQL